MLFNPNHVWDIVLSFCKTNWLQMDSKIKSNGSLDHYKAQLVERAWDEL